MLGFRPLFLTFVALLHAIVPAASHPILSAKWIKTSQFEDSQSRGIWRVLGNNDSPSGPELSFTAHRMNHVDPTVEREAPDHKSKRDSSSGKSIISVLVPVSPSSAQSHKYSHEDQDSSYRRLKSITTHKTNHHYGKIPGHPQKQTNALHNKETTSSSTTTFSTASLKLASGQSISFFSYRITLPFLNFASSSFPQFQLPGVFTTVMVLLAMVWIAIVMIGLVEFGNYLWRKKVAAMTGEREDRVGDESSDEGMEMVKVPLNVVGSSGGSGVDYQDAEAILSSTSESANGSDSERDDYCF